MKLLIFALLLFACLLLPEQSVFAHVLITNEAKTKGAILHIIPDDDPIAGEESSLYFDMQDEIQGSENLVVLTIREPSGTETFMEAEIDGTLATAKYTFPEQGIYDLTFTVASDGEAYTFNHSQRVSRGIIIGPLDKTNYAWAEILLLVSGLGLIILVIIVFNRRKEITAQSTF